MHPACGENSEVYLQPLGSANRRICELASRLIRNQLPRKRLRVRVPCPPLLTNTPGNAWFSGVFFFANLSRLDHSKMPPLIQMPQLRALGDD